MTIDEPTVAADGPSAAEPPTAEPSAADPPAADPPAELSPEEYANLAAAIEQQIGRVIVGQTDLVRLVLICLVCEGHALLEGVPGLGKTQLLKTLAGAVDLDFSGSSSPPT